jgi:glucose-6-phosphate isomerase
MPPAPKRSRSPRSGHKRLRVLVADVGGSSVKLRVGTRGPIVRFRSGPKLTARGMVECTLAEIAAAGLRYDVVSIGYPGLVFHGRITSEPHNLGGGWVRFDFAKAFGKPVRVINDAAMQAMGSYEGGRMLFLGLGTGLGAALVIDGRVEPMEVGHMPYKHGHSYEHYVGKAGLRRMGLHKWRKIVLEVVELLRWGLEADYVVLGGGNVKNLPRLPKGVHRGDNRNAFIGGVRLWGQHGKRLRVARRRG